MKKNGMSALLEIESENRRLVNVERKRQAA